MGRAKNFSGDKINQSESTNKDNHHIMNSNQFVKMTLNDAIDHYQRGDLTAKGLLHLYFKIKIAPGWTMNKTQKEICDELGIKKTAFYNALSRLKAEGSINWSVPDNTKFSISLPFRETGNHSAIAESQTGIAESQTGIAESQTGIAESQTGIAENKPSKPAPNIPSSDSPDLYSDSYQIYLISLSEGERKNFLNFCQEEAKTLPKPPTLPMRWIERNLEDLKAKWESFNGTNDDNVSEQSNKFSVWANHPRFDELWQNVCQHGTTSYVIQNIRDTTIKDFCKFCHESKEIMEEILSCLNSR